MILSKVLHMSFSLKVNYFCIYNNRLLKQYDTELSKCGSLPGGDAGDESKKNRRQYRERFFPQKLKHS